MSEKSVQFERGGLVITDMMGRIVYGSESMVARTGFRHPETIGAKPGSLWGGAMPRDFYDDMWGKLRAGKLITATFRNHRKNGTAYLEELSLALLIGNEKKPAYYIAVAPFHLAPETHQNFKQEFEKVFAPKKQSGTNLTKWLSRWLGGEGKTSLLGLAGIEEFLLEPTRKLYEYRMDDARLVERAQANPNRFSPLYEKYFPYLERYFLARVNHDREVARDMAQDVFLRAFEKLPAFHTENASFGTYLLRIAHNLLIDRYRRATRMDKLRVADVEECEGVVRPTSELEVNWALLSALDRELMDLKYQEGYSIREIATRTRLTENAVKLRLSRARKKLRTC